MAKNLPKTAVKGTANAETKSKKTQKGKDLLEKIDAYLDKSLNWLILVQLVVAFIFSLLLFDSKVSLSGDDAFYIIRANDFIHSFKYPSFQGPLYPMVLSIVVAFSGINLIPLKLLSLASMLGFIYLFFKSLRNRIPSTLLVFTSLAVCINSFILYYASQTYSEAFYMFIQMLLVLVFFNYFIDIKDKISVKQDIRRHIILAFCILAIVLTRSVGFSAFIAVAGYFLLRGEWKNLLFSVIAFGSVFLIFQGIKYSFWHEGGMQFAAQGSGLLNKDYYNPQSGKEDLAGLFSRLLKNSDLYFSKHFMYIFGFRGYAQFMPVYPVLTVIVYLFLAGSIFTFRKNNYLFFISLITGSFTLVTFIVLQATWDQSRLIIPVIPFILLLVLSCIYFLTKMPKLKAGQIGIPVLAIIILLTTFAQTAKSFKFNLENPGRYGGLTPDWKNYLIASEWAAKNLPKEAVIACRKPSISFVYGKGRNFYGIMQLPAYSSEDFIRNWQKEDSSVMVFKYKEFEGKQMTPVIYNRLKNNEIALLFSGDKVFFAEKLSDTARILLQKDVKTLNVQYYVSAKEFMSKDTVNIKELKVYYPDSLLLQLQKGNVTHFLTANIRRNSARKDGMIINTVERYMAFIQDKYPQMFTKVYQMGTDDNEPASVYQIEYEKYGLPVSRK